MTLGNMRHLGVQRLVATWLNDACRHQGVIDVSKYPDDIGVSWSGVCSGRAGRRKRSLSSDKTQFRGNLHERCRALDDG